MLASADMFNPEVALPFAYGLFSLFYLEFLKKPPPTSNMHPGTFLLAGFPRWHPRPRDASVWHGVIAPAIVMALFFFSFFLLPLCWNDVPVNPGHQLHNYFYLLLIPYQKSSFLQSARTHHGVGSRGRLLQAGVPFPLHCHRKNARSKQYYKQSRKGSLGGIYNPRQPLLPLVVRPPPGFKCLAWLLSAAPMMIGDSFPSSMAESIQIYSDLQNLLKVRRFTPRGLIRTSWPLPPSFSYSSSPLLLLFTAPDFCCTFSPMGLSLCPLLPSPHHQGLFQSLNRIEILAYTYANICKCSIGRRMQGHS